MIERSSIDAVMRATDIVDVVNDFVSLKRRGSNMQGLCPFHNEKTPSFSVSPSKQIYKCFGCGEAGNAVSFLMNLEKMDYVEAIKYLANKYKIELVETEMTDEKKTELKEIESLSIIYKAAQGFFQSQLNNSEEGKTIGLSYFKERGLSPETMELFGLGYNGREEHFYSWALNQGYNKDLLLKSGLISESNGNYYDKYRERVIFPIHNLSGKVVGFGARILDSSKKTAKYLNSPENELYHKSKILYGLFQARRAISKKGQAILTEGYMDVLSLHQHGLDNTIASSGTSLTKDQISLLHKYTKELVILYDSDAAGIKAAQKAVEMSLEEGISAYVVQLDEGEDPDSYVQKYGGPSLQEFIDQNKKDFVDFFFQAYPLKDEFDIETKNNLTNALAQAVAKINRIEDLGKQSAYIHKISQKLSLDEGAVIGLVNKYKNENYRNQKRQEARQESQVEIEPILSKNREFQLGENSASEFKLLRILLKSPEKKLEEGHTIRDYVREVYEQEHILHPDAKYFLEKYLERFDQNEDVTIPSLTNHPDPKFSRIAIDLTTDAHKLSDNWKEYQIHLPEQDEIEAEDIESTFLYFNLREVKKMLLEEIEHLKTATDIQEMRGIQESIRLLKDAEKSMLEKLGTTIIK